MIGCNLVIRFSSLEQQWSVGSRVTNRAIVVRSFPNCAIVVRSFPCPICPYFWWGDHNIIGAIVIIQNYQIIDVVQALQSLGFRIRAPSCWLCHNTSKPTSYLSRSFQIIFFSWFFLFVQPIISQWYQVPSLPSPLPIMLEQEQLRNHNVSLPWFQSLHPQASGKQVSNKQTNIQQQCKQCKYSVYSSLVRIRLSSNSYKTIWTQRTISSCVSERQRKRDKFFWRTHGSTRRRIIIPHYSQHHAVTEYYEDAPISPPTS